MRAVLALLCLLSLAACEAVFGPEPTLTPTPLYPELRPSPSPDIRYPTEISGDIPMGDGITIPVVAGLPAQSGVATEIALPEISLPSLITVTLRDGSFLNAEVYAGQTGRPGILLVGSTFEDWGGVPVTLRDLGYTVLTVQGGVSLNALNLSAMLDMLSVQPNLDPTRLLVMGVEDGATMALVGCASDSRCIGAVVISPVSQETLTAAARAMGPRPALFAASSEDGDSLAVAEAARQAAQNALLQPFERAGRGAQILSTRPDFVRLLGDWLAEVSGQ